MSAIERVDAEVEKQRITFYRKISADEFIQVFLNDLAGLLKIESMAEYKVMVHLWKIASFKDHGMGNKLILVKAVKEEIAKETGYSLQTVSNTIATFVKKRLLISEDRSIYYLNPVFFFKGKEQDRKSAIERYEVRIEYEVNESIAANTERARLLSGVLEE